MTPISADGRHHARQPRSGRRPAGRATRPSLHGTTLDFASLVARGFVVAGGAEADHLRGTNLDDRLDGGGGDDWLDGGAGDDWLDGGLGDDTYVLRAGAGHDRVVDAGGDDVAWWTGGIGPADLAFARAGDDLVALGAAAVAPDMAAIRRGSSRRFCSTTHAHRDLRWCRPRRRRRHVATAGLYPAAASQAVGQAFQSCRVYTGGNTSTSPTVALCRWDRHGPPIPGAQGTHVIRDVGGTEDRLVFRPPASPPRARLAAPCAHLVIGLPAEPAMYGARLVSRVALSHRAHRVRRRQHAGR